LTDVNFERRDYFPFLDYGQSKSANVLMTVELARRAAAGITALVVHPGTIITTDLTRYMEGDTINKLLDMGGDTFAPESAKTESQGAARTVWAATCPPLRKNGGTLLADCHLVMPGPNAIDPATAKQLWELSESWVAQR
jgi:NAD(P)-dependent dehydrogenase (short-subunit alcohol dehydrogenase family)